MTGLIYLERLARTGRLSPEDFVQAHNMIDTLSEINTEAIRKRERGKKLEVAVDNYRRGMARNWGLDCSLPVEDRN